MVLVVVWGDQAGGRGGGGMEKQRKKITEGRMAVFAHYKQKEMESGGQEKNGEMVEN